MTPSAAGDETQAQSTGTTALNSAAGTQAQVVANNSQYNGNVQDTAAYKNDVTAGTQAVTTGSDAASRNLKQSMEAAGVQGNSGVVQGNTAANQAVEAGQLSGVKTNAFKDVAGLQQQANAGDTAVTGQQTTEGDTQTGMANADEQARLQQGYKNQAALSQALLQAGTTALG